MPYFAYVARDRSGGRLTGVMEGISGSAVAQRLAQDGAIPISIQETGSSSEASKATNDEGVFASKVPPLEIIMFCRQMHTLLKAGVPILRALGGLVDSIANKRFRRIIADLKESLESGRELSQALAVHEAVFSPFMVAMVRMGESSGKLEEVFLRLFHHFEFQKFMREQVKTALRYPSFVVAAMLLSLAVINIWVIPAFAKTFANLGAELPLMTRILIASSEFTLKWWPAILVSLVGGFFAFRMYTQTEGGRFVWDKLKLRIPVAGNILRMAAYARFCRSMALSLQSGLGIVQALALVQEVVENSFIASRIEQMRVSVARGESVLRAAAATEIFTPTVLQMVMVGEESGMLDEMFAEVADLYQNDVEYSLKSLSAQIEPILIVVLGAIVLVLALGIFLPMWELGSAMGKR